MLKRLNPFDVHKGVRQLLKEHTDYIVLDSVPLDEKAPFIFVELMEIKADDTKTMFRDNYKFLVHAIADGKTSKDIYAMIHQVSEALTVEIQLENGYKVIPQSYNGLRNVYKEETGEKHAVLECEFKIFYGYKMK